MIDILMQQIINKTPVLKNCLEQFALHNMDEYLSSILSNTSSIESIYSCQDLCDAVYDYLEPLLGKQLADGTAKQIFQQKLMLSANHHEIEYCAQSLQGNILYERLLVKKGFTNRNIPIFTNSTVSMSNSNFPRGMLIYNTIKMEEIIKIPIFPFKQRNSIVAVSDPFTEKMVIQAREAVNKQKNIRNISKKVSDTAIWILENLYLADDVLSCDRYADQVVILNKRLGHELYKNQRNEFIYIEMEEISKRLIENDIRMKNNLGYAVLFNKELRERILNKLNNIAGCWKTEELKLYIKKYSSYKNNGMIPGGTHFFWGIDSKKRRFSLIIEKKDREYILTGINMDGIRHSYQYTPESILNLLKTRKIIPGLMLTFLQLYMLRDITMLGGCFQSEYLKIMNWGLIQSLKEIRWCDKEIEHLYNKKSYYLSGPIFLLGGEIGNKYPMSTVEIICEGKIEDEALQRSMNLTMQKAHEAGLFHFYTDVIKKNDQLPNWWKGLSELI